MDETVVRGLIVGLVFAVIGVIADQVWKLIRSPSEGARRFKIVSGIALVLLVGGIMIEGMGPVGALGTTIAIAAVVWVIKGFKKQESARVTRPTAEPRRPAPEPDAPVFAEVSEIKPTTKTVITCPNCSGRLRVVVGKYIDVTCPHCKTVFRTHT